VILDLRHHLQPIDLNVTDLVLTRPPHTMINNVYSLLLFHIFFLVFDLLSLKSQFSSIFFQPFLQLKIFSAIVYFDLEYKKLPAY